MSAITAVPAPGESSSAAATTAAADRGAFLDGVRAMLPMLLGVAPFGLVIGVTVAELGLPHLAGWSLGWLVYAGSAQLAAVGLLAGSASGLVVVASVAVINLRLALYSAAMAPHWRGTSTAWRLVAAYLLVDPSFAIGTRSYDGSRSR
jgi:predicted branched-subunit amino acid permease